MSTEKEIFENYVTSEKIPYVDSFESEEFHLKNEILNGIYGYGFHCPSPIQRVGIKPIIDGRDVVIQSQSGSGKTATFLIGMLQQIDFNLKETQAIVLANSKDLADQIVEVFKNLSKYCGITYRLCIGGDLSNRYALGQTTEHVIIGTPGRICDLLGKRVINGESIKILIVDEADEVLSSSFKKQVKTIFNSVTNNVQTVLVSATIPPEMSSLLDMLMKKNYISILVKDEDLTLDEIKQYYVVLDENYKNLVVLDIYKHMSIGQAIIYTNKKNKAEEISYYLEENGYKSGILHGDMMQNERRDILNDFKDGKRRILITTDVLSRGIDIQAVSLVINYDMPKYSQTYIHRIGRSGRFGREGVAINFVTKREKNIINYIEKTYNTKINYLPEKLSEII